MASCYSKSRACIARCVHKSASDAPGEGLGFEADGDSVGVSGCSMAIGSLLGDVGGGGEGVTTRLEPNSEVVG